MLYLTIRKKTRIAQMISDNQRVAFGMEMGYPVMACQPVFEAKHNKGFFNSYIINYAIMGTREHGKRFFVQPVCFKHMNSSFPFAVKNGSFGALTHRLTAGGALFLYKNRVSITQARYRYPICGVRSV
jgi:hypothetical protein